MPAEIRRRRDELVLAAQRVDDAVAVFAAASARLRRLVPFDAAVWLTTDPGTGLPTAPTLADNLELDGDREQCSAMWRREFLVADVNLYRDLARAEVPAAALRATVADPAQSARYREFLDPQGYGDELRAVLRVGDSPWARSTCSAAAARPPSPRPRPSWWPACRPRWGRRCGSAPDRPTRSAGSPPPAGPGCCCSTASWW
ncbi:MAG TPA: LuxR family transcriptional regulator, partial [Actinomycetes bacterium]|nr:LuxR family transcriptional regulator [Actinomycetes bacterium]